LDCSTAFVQEEDYDKVIRRKTKDKRKKIKGERLLIKVPLLGGVRGGFLKLNKVIIM
jgi:hypothetical protein